MAGTALAAAPHLDPIVGIDIAARWFDVARGPALRRFPNTAAGVSACVRWLGTFSGDVRVGLEATGTYSLPLATALHAAGHTVFVCNPLSLARYRQATLARTKTDKLDAQCIARFCAVHALHPWSPVSEDHQRLHVLVAARQTLLAQVQQLRNRQHAAGFTSCDELVRDLQAPVLAALTAQIARIEQELTALSGADTQIGTQLRLLTSVPGIGLTTAAALVASLPVGRLATAKQVAAYVGLCPREKSSGTSVRGHSSIGSFGPAHLRRALYLPAIVAMRANPRLRVVAERLRAKGKPAKVVIVAVMRKLLLLAWTLLRTRQPFSASGATAPPASLDHTLVVKRVCPPTSSTAVPAGT